MVGEITFTEAMYDDMCHELEVLTSEHKVLVQDYNDLKEYTKQLERELAAERSRWQRG